VKQSSAPAFSRRGFLGGSLITAAYPQPPAARPNVIVFLADDLGYNDVGYQGGEIETPNIDRLSREGVRFTQMYSFPLCSPTRAGLMTGRSPMRYGLMYFVIRPWCPYGLPPDEQILPQTFKASGYQTAILGKWHLGHAHRSLLPNARGFDHFYGHVNGAIDYFAHTRDGGLDWQRNGVSVKEQGYSTDLLAGEAVRWIRARDRARPFLLYMPFNAPHSPLQAPDEVVRKYAGIKDERRRAFAPLVDRLDQAIGKILTAVQSEGIAQNTLVLFFSDNGGPLQAGARNHPLRGGKATVYEGGVRVPAIMRWPGRLPAGGVSNQVLTVLDLFPTLAGAAGLTPRAAKPLDGKNLWPAIENNQTIARENLFFAVEPNESDRLLAVRQGQWKLVRKKKKHPSEWEDELFDLSEDPGERNDLAAKHPVLVRKLGGELENWQALHPQADILSSRPAHPGWVAPRDWARAASE
jgi:arylsulfatase A-like enzyme